MDRESSKSVVAKALAEGKKMPAKTLFDAPLIFFEAVS